MSPDVGRPTPGEVVEIVAVNVTVDPAEAGVPDVPTAVVVFALITVCVSIDEVLVA